MINQILQAPIELVTLEECTNDKCRTKIQMLQQEYDALQTEIKNSQKKIHELLVSNAKKDLEIRQLKTELTDNRFNEFDGKLSSNTMVN